MQKNQELFFNVLKFDWPTEALEFHFFEDEIPGAERIYHTVVPDEIKEAVKAGCKDVEKLRELKKKSIATQTL